MIDFGRAPRRPDRVLILKPSSLGDVVTAMPVLRGLRRTFPEAHIAWLLATDCLPIVQGDADLNEIIPFNRRKLGDAWHSLTGAAELTRLLKALRRGRFDWVIDLQGLLRSGLLAAATFAPLRAGFADTREGAGWFYTHAVRVQPPHTVDRNVALARELDIDARPEDMTLRVPPDARQAAEELLGRHGLAGREYVVCVLPTRGRVKLYPVRHWRAVIAGLAARRPVVLAGASSEKPLCDAAGEGLTGAVVNLAGQTTVPQFVAVIAASAGVVCCDSAAKFIAPAVGVDCVTLMGPTRTERTGPYLRGSAVVSPATCQGCLKRRCRHVACMEMIAPADVIAAAERMLGAARS